MGLAINILIGVLVFGYATWTLTSFIRKSKKGKCASCELNKNCQSSCDSNHVPMKEKRIHK